MQLDAYADAMLALTERLVALATENPPGTDYGPCVELLAQTLTELGMPPELVGEPDAPVLRAGAGDGPALVFHGHYDVVPAQAREQFVPRRAGGRLYGRGSADMKSGLAAMIYAAVAVRDAGGHVRLHLVPDEETGGRRGSAVLRDRGLLADGAIGMLTAEPTSGVIWHANRGAISLRATVHGREAHVGLYSQGVDAFAGMLEIADELRALRDGTRSILLVGGECTSGANFNVVPASCTFTVDRRPDPDEDLDAERARLLAVFDRARERGWEVDIDVFQDMPAAASAPDDELGRHLADAIAEVEGRRPAFEMCPGLLETRWYAQQGLPAFAYGPGRLEVAHGPDEWVDEAAVVRCAQVYALTAARMLGRSGG